MIKNLFSNKKELSITGHLINFSTIIILSLIIVSSVLFYFYYGYARSQLERRVTDHAEVMRKVLNSKLSTVIRFVSHQESICSNGENSLENLQWALGYGLQIDNLSLFYYNQNNMLTYQRGTLGGNIPNIRDLSRDFKGTLPSGENYKISSLLQDENKNYYNQVRVLVNCNGQHRGNLIINLPNNYWKDAMHSLEDIPGLRVSIMDSESRFIDSGFPGYVGEVFNDNRLKNNPQHLFLETRGGKKPLMIAFNRSELSGWYIAAAVARPSLYVSLFYSYLIIFGISAILFILLVILAYIFSKRISKPILQLSLAANTLKTHNPPKILHTSVKEVNSISYLLNDAYHTIEKSYSDLRDREERYRLATDVFQGAVIEYDGIRNTIFCSPKFYEMFGDGVIWTNVFVNPDLPAFHPEDKGIVRKSTYNIFHTSSSKEELEYRIKGKDGNWLWIWERLAITRNEQGIPTRIIGALLDVTEQKRIEERLSLVINELNHRVKNTLVIVQSLAANTIRDNRPIKEALALFETRLISLARAHDLITKNQWEGANVQEVVSSALEPFLQKDIKRFVIEGSNVTITSQTAISLAMALYEMGTNATKYGALANNEGKVYISWVRKKEIIDGEPLYFIEFQWKEKGGPQILTTPTRKGFGTRLLRRSFSSDPNSKITIKYQKDGIYFFMRWTCLPPEGEETLLRTL